jgi:hypothetical protein
VSDDQTVANAPDSRSNISPSLNIATADDVLKKTERELTILHMDADSENLLDLIQRTDRHLMLEMQRLAHARGLCARNERAEQDNALGVGRPLRRLFAERRVERIEDRGMTPK